ncbi:MAG: O-antigen ligase family protein, partial [Lentisphaerales bacterium]|nr:O-antigen ligase family protein [Lentisphaerales bacterium]
SSAVIIVAIMFGSFLNYKNWITFPKDKFTYDIYLEKNDQLRLLEKNSSFNENPKIISSSGHNRLAPIKKNLYSYKCNNSGRYKVSISLNTTTATPWKYAEVKINNKHSYSAPPRILQLDSSLGYRTEIWAAGLNEICKKPFLGHGLSTDKRVHANGRTYNDFHNFFIGTAYKTGILGLALYTSLLLFTLIILIKHKDISYITLLTFGLIMTCFDDESFFNNIHAYWLLLLIPISKALSLQTKKKCS